MMPVSAAPDANSILTTVRRNHGEADRMLDALRGDVYRAVLSGTRGDTEHIKAIQIEFAGHAQNFKARIAVNGELNIDKSLRTDLQALQTLLDAYIRSAEYLIAIAGDQEKAVAKLQGFQDAFEALGKAMSAISDRIDAQVAQRKQAVEQSTRISRSTVVSATLLAVTLALLSIVGLTRYRNTAGATPRVVDTLRTRLISYIGRLHGVISRLRDGGGSQKISIKPNT
jgi:methyl-accepting chemotaxis protein